MQASAIGKGEVALVAPLYYDAVHLIVRADSEFGTITELVGRRVSIGLPQSGMRGERQAPAPSIRPERR